MIPVINISDGMAFYAISGLCALCFLLGYAFGCIRCMLGFIMKKK